MNERSQATGKMVFRIPGVPTPRLSIIIPKPGTALSTIVLLTYGFIALILIGGILLMLPVSSKSGDFTSPIVAFFTAASAVCLTGLAVVDSGTHWSASGQGILFALFQIGGLGFIIGAMLILRAFGGRFGLKERLVIADSMGLDQLGGVLSIVFRVTIFVLIVEAIGAAFFYFWWTATGTPDLTLWTAIFHSASAFNNCGMDLFGNFQSMAGFQNDAVVLVATAFLIILGSTGYVILADVFKHRRFSRMSLESKLVLTTILVLLVAGTALFFVAEYSSAVTLGPLAFPQKLAAAFFQSVAPRTAGFSAVDINSLRSVSLFFTIFLMFVGGAAGSVSGGVKVNTIGVLAITAFNAIRGRHNIDAFGRQLTTQTVYRAISFAIIYLVIIAFVVLLLSFTETFPIDSIIFEAFSALGTVGLTTGITPDLSLSGKLIIIITMFVGRLAPVAFMALIARYRQPIEIDYPHETVRLG